MNNSTSARKYCAQPAALMAKGQYFVGIKHPLCRSTGGSLSKNLIEFAPAGAKKVRSFSSATCASKKILLGLQTCAPSASGGRRVRCSQAADPFVKKYYFLTDATPPVPQHRGCPLWCFSNRQRSAYRSGYFCDSSASSASQSRGGLSSVHVSGEVLSARSYSWPLVASCTAA